MQSVRYWDSTFHFRTGAVRAVFKSRPRRTPCHAAKLSERLPFDSYVAGAERSSAVWRHSNRRQPVRNCSCQRAGGAYILGCGEPKRKFRLIGIGP